MERSLLKRLGLLAIIALSVAAVAIAPSFGNQARLGSYWTTTFAWDSATGGQVGGETRTYNICATETLYVAEVVYLKPGINNTVCRSSTLADYNNVAGVVVGGTFTGMTTIMSQPDTGTKADTAAFPNGKVIVLVRGRTWVVSDSAGIAAGFALIPSTSLGGRVKARTTAIDTFGRAFGKLVDSAIVKIPTLANIVVK